jgi:beta-mannosidase
MTASLHRHRGRQPLSGNWLVCAIAPDDPPPALADESSWLRIAEPMSAAAALRQVGQWSLADAARSFDAQDWCYRLEFDALPDGRQGMVLGFDGLATVAQVWLNEKLLLSSTNMFVRHECEVGDLLRARGNQLLLRFNALEVAQQLRRPRPRWRTPMVAHQQLRWFRTTLLGRTPGWSPPAAVVGPWRDIWLEPGDPASPRKLRLEAAVVGDAGVVDCRLQLGLAASSASTSVDLRLERRGRIEVQPLKWDDSAQCFAGQLHLRQVDLWWPHTHGEPALYEASVGIRTSGAAEESIVSIGRVGFRTIALDTADGDFSLKVNGVPVFCRGACWTPLDPVSLRSTPAACHAAVAQARAAGMNMLRVAGTTVYEEDHFYEACDEEGMLVWQDFMFANMDYPGQDAEFAASVELEVRQQLQRLHARPCLAVLCGNSEVEQQAAMWGAPRELWRCSLFDETLPRLCVEVAPRTPYWPSSAHAGAFPHQANTGTTSYYGVGAYLRPLDDARRAELKFATECLAFANIPAPSAIARMPGGMATRVHHAGWKQRSPRDLGAGWDFDDVRDHYLQLLFNTDPQKLRSTDHDRYLALGRLATAETMTASFAEWRRPASPCRGALVLMLRDLWAGAGWGVVDDAGVPKACWHALKRVLQPVTVLLSDEGVNGLFAHVVNESAEAQAIELELAAWRDGDVKVAAGGRTLAVPARGGSSVAVAGLLDHFMDLGYAYRFGPMPCDAVVATLRDPQGRGIARAFHFPGGLPAQAQADVGLAACVAQLDDDTAVLRVRTGRLALGVHFDIPGVVADDEHFHLPPDAEVDVTLRGRGRPLSGLVHAINSIKPARIEQASSMALANHTRAAPSGSVNSRDP